jgi:hypothetical protein
MAPRCGDFFMRRLLHAATSCGDFFGDFFLDTRAETAIIGVVTWHT